MSFSLALRLLLWPGGRAAARPASLCGSEAVGAALPVRAYTWLAATTALMDGFQAGAPHQGWQRSQPKGAGPLKRRHPGWLREKHLKAHECLGGWGTGCTVGSRAWVWAGGRGFL